MRIIVTGAAGFIGFHCVQRFLALGHEVIGVDNINSYYDVRLKYARLRETGIENVQEGIAVQSTKYPNYQFIKGDLSDAAFVKKLMNTTTLNSQLSTHNSQPTTPAVIVHLAAQAGVRYSLENPDAYIQSNILGFYNILEACRENPVHHLIYASSSSVYGNSMKVPFKETDMTDDTVSLYAATKKSNELFAFNYSHLFRIPTTGLRFFTVYGPWGRPDMAYYGFAEKISRGEEIKLFNAGDMYRDFTYIDDIVEGITRLLDKPPVAQAPEVPKRVLNIGHSDPVYMKDFMRLIQEKLGVEAKITNMPMQDTDVYKTYADVSALEALTGYHPQTAIADGLGRFLDWYRGYDAFK
ncbi:MAG: hypothetical protein RLY85_1058 [Bacteroidota bacterium]